MATPTTATSGAGSKKAKAPANKVFLDVFEKEYSTTVRVLKAYPAGKADLRPHPKCRTALELAWLLVRGQALIEKALTTGFDWSVPPSAPPTPPTMDAVLQAFEQVHERVAKAVRGLRDEQLSETVQFFVAPKTLGDVPKLDFMWMLLHDQIHHRGQFSIYLRMADGKVPSIYGPTADEPWN